MKRLIALAIACASLLVVAPLASAKATDGYGIELTVDGTMAETGQIEFSFTPVGFSFAEVPYAGGKDKAGEGHVHIYALPAGKKKGAKYIGWSADGTTGQMTDKKMLKPGRSYVVFARFSFNDHRERKSIMSNWVRVTIPAVS